MSRLTALVSRFFIASTPDGAGFCLLPTIFHFVQIADKLIFIFNESIEETIVCDFAYLNFRLKREVIASLGSSKSANCMVCLYSNKICIF